MADTLAPTDPDARNALIPLPRDTPDLVWQEAADAIAKLNAARKPPFPHCGAPSTLDDANLVAHLLGAIDGGLSPAQAGNALGCTTGTVPALLAKAEKQPENDALALFASAVKSAQDRRRWRLLGSIESAGHKGAQYWTAHAWLLERGYGNDYKLAQDKTGGQVIIQIGVKEGDLQLAVGDTGGALRLPE